MSDAPTRSAVSITFSVWRALLLREALTRLFGRRAAWFWLLLEPAVHAGFLMLLFAVVRVRHVGGFQTPMWVLLGLIAYFFFQRTSRQAAGAVRANYPFFAYRQVVPVDAVLSRAFLEGALMVVVAVLLLLAAGFFGLRAWPADPLKVLFVISGMWTCGLGFGLISSVVEEMSSELGLVLGMASRPLYLLSGVMFPLASLPPVFRDALLLNPLAHGVELLRLGFAPYYHAVPGVSLGYLHVWGLALTLCGLLLQLGFARRMASE